MRRCRLALKLTYRCPGLCSYCDERKSLWKVRGGRDMPLTLVDTVLNSLMMPSGHPFEEIHMTGGEISTYPHLEELLRMLGIVDLPLTLTTSGRRPRRVSWGELLLHYPIQKIFLSLDDAEASTNDEIRGNGSHKIALNAIREAVQLRQTIDRPEVTVISVIHRQNVRHLRELIHLLLELDVDRWMPAHLEAVQHNPALALTSSDLRWLKAQCERDSLLQRCLGKTFDPDFVPWKLLVNGGIPVGQPTLPCSTIGRLAIVHPGGNVYPCYGSEHAQVPLLTNLVDDPYPDWHALMTSAIDSRFDVCRACPEPLQASRPLR